MGDNIKMFMPGSHPGPMAAGFAADSHIMSLVAKQLKMAKIPTGDAVADHFPWMRYTREWVGPGEQIVASRQQWDNVFHNNTARPILVTEVRVYLGNQEGRGEEPATRGGTVHGVALGIPPITVPLLQKSLWIKMSIPDRKDIFQKWVPYPLMNTVGDFHAAGEVDRLAFPLPAPYFLNRSNPFVIDVAQNEAMLGPSGNGGETAFYLTLHGWGAEDGQPIDLVQRVPAVSTSEYNPWLATPIVFNEDRDMPMRDAWITHIGVGAGYRNNGVVTDALGWVLQHAQIRLQAPEGPTWHSGEMFPIALLAEQIAGLWTTDQAVVAIPAGARHIPVVPYILFPGESLKIELWNRTDIYAKKLVPVPPGAEATAFQVDVGVLGIQERS